MGGVNAKNTRASQPDAPANVLGTKHFQPKPWIATGKGWFNKLPNFPATANNANGSLTNRAVDPSDPLYRIYLFITSVQTGWSLSGNYGQGKTGRVFYPQNLTQDDLIIQGQVANQYEYDRIAQFVSNHQMTQFTSDIPIQFSLDGDNSYPGLEFRLFKPLAGKTYDGFTPFNNVVAVTQIQAGHRRFKNMPTFSLTCKVLYNGAEQSLTLWDDINRIISRQDVFGATVSPSGGFLDLTTGSYTPGSSTISAPPSGSGSDGGGGSTSTVPGIDTNPNDIPTPGHNIPS